MPQYLTSYYDEIQQWYVVFGKRSKPRHCWFHWLVPSDFVHCFLVRELPDGKTMTIDFKTWGVGVSFIDQPVEEYLLQQCRSCASAVLGYTADYRRQVMPRWRGVLTCVTLTKAVLGLWKCAHIQRPYALYKLLLRYPTTTVIKPYVPFLRGV